jgi:endonuclease-3
MFYWRPEVIPMQLSLCLDAHNALPTVYERLRRAFGSFREGPRTAPLDQLILAMISARTPEDMARSVFARLKARFHPWEELLAAKPEEIAALLAPVPHAEAKAVWLSEALGRLRVQNGSLTLDNLAVMDTEDALAWLCRLPGVGDRIAGTTLNFSTLRRPAMVVDAHVWRVARRIGLAPRPADPEGVRRTITEAAPGEWTGEDFFDLHWLLKRLGQTLCGETRARCGACPIASLCEERRRMGEAGRGGNVLTLRREPR